jgi:hypothetical protein
MGAGGSSSSALVTSSTATTPATPATPATAAEAPKRPSADSLEPKPRKHSLTGLMGMQTAPAPIKAGPPGRRSSAQHVQEEAASFRSKSSSIKMMMRNQAYRKSFFTFLETMHKGKEEMMDFFLLMETMKKNREKDAKRASFMAEFQKYEQKSQGKSDDLPESLIFSSMHHWKGVENLSDEDLAKHIERSADDILLALTPLFESFLESPYFLEVKATENREEKRRFSAHSS